MEKELIKLKGTIDGVKIYLDSEGQISDIITSLYDRLRQFRKFFGDGHCNIYFVGRPLTPSDKMRLEAVVSAMLPEGSVNYGERKRVSSENEVEKTLELTEEALQEARSENEQREDEEERPFREIKQVVTTNFKSSRARFYEGAVCDGKIVESDGHLILLGDVEKGGKLAAVGNVIVLGGIYGSVEAGCMGNDNAYVIALKFAPEEIRIAKYQKRFTQSEIDEFSLPQKAFVLDEWVYTEDFVWEDEETDA